LYFQIGATSGSDKCCRRTNITKRAADARFRNLSARYAGELNLNALFLEKPVPLRNGRQYRAKTDSAEAKQIDPHLRVSCLKMLAKRSLILV
jgi:hypothetical protein